MIPMTDPHPDPTLVEEVAAHLRAGGLIAYPTETVYGFGGLARSDAVARLEAVKPRSGKSGFLILVNRPDRVADLGWTPAATRLAQAFWPGPLTLVLSDPAGSQPSGVKSPEGTVAVRVSPHPFVTSLLEGLDTGLTSTSANAPGRPPARNAAAAGRAADELGAGPELWLVDGGELPVSPPSTLVDASGSTPRVLREGAISEDRIRTVMSEAHD